MVVVGLNLLLFCRRYKNVIHFFVATNTKEVIELKSLTKTDNWWNEIFLDEKKHFIKISALAIDDQIGKKLIQIINYWIFKIIDIIRTQNARTIVWSIGIYYILSILLDQLQTNINQIWLNIHFQFSVP